MSHEEVIQILKEMHDDCSERIDCAGCKFLAMNDTCSLRMIPAEWRLDLLKGRISKEDKPIMHYEESWDRLYTWLNDMRFSIAPDETVTDVDERNDRSIQVNLLDEIMMIMNDMEEK